MIALLQRVTRADVTVDGSVVGAIEKGLLVFIGIEKHDDEERGRRLLERVLTYRVFPDEAGRMNRSVRDIDGGILLVSQFTLVADTNSGTRPSFSTAADPATAARLYQALVEHACAVYPKTATGVFGADMKVGLVNDGPVTFWLEV